MLADQECLLATPAVTRKFNFKTVDPTSVCEMPVQCGRLQT